MAVLTFGVQGLAGSAAQVAPHAAVASGSVGPGTLDQGPRAAVPAAPAASAAPSTFTADALALLAFTRSTVETTSKEGVGGQLNVASAGLQRPAAGTLMAPLEILQESSPFGLRTSPVNGSAGEFHWGQDYAAACGTRVYSADAGVVRAVGWHPWGGGNRVEIDHGNGLITTYNHLEAIAVKKGDSVRVGEVIARVGTTGSSTGCHLHFETILNGSHKDPHGWKLLPIKQLDQLGTMSMTSYEPFANRAANASLGWAIPVSEDLTHEVTGGVQETVIPSTPSSPKTTPTADATATPSAPDSLSPTKKPAKTPTPATPPTSSVTTPRPTPT
ncbi:M23 family metallopeptidase, partial [Arthrobacter sp. SO5]|uniref:M23 family metallopeptidase n=1 Tax=Arthrobacter sp. SO5 TaxID=1897055 RepID=UPI001E389A94